MNAPLKTFPRWMGAALVAILFALVILGAWYYRNEDQAIRQAAEEQLNAIGQLKADQVAAWREERLADAAVLTESPFFSQGVARFLSDARDANSSSFILRFRSLQLHYHYDAILLVNPQGRVLLRAGGQASLDEACRVALGTALGEHKPVVSELYSSAQDPTPNIAAVAPIFAGDASDAPPIGAVVLVSDATRFLYPLIQSWPTLSKTAETELIRRDGETALFLNNLRHQPDTALKLRVPLSRADAPAVMAALGRQGIFQGRDYRGVEVLAVILPVPESSWFIVSKQDIVEVFAARRFHALLLLTTYLAIVGGFGAIGLLAWQRRMKAHYQALYLAEAKQRASEHKYQLLFENMTTGFALYEMIHDPEGRPLDYRIIEVNPAFEKLIGIRGRDWIGRTLKEVAPEIEPYWLDIFDKVAQTGESVAYENYASRFGRYFDAWAFSPAENMVAVVFSDITERKRAEEEARRNHLKKIESLRRMAGGIAHHYNNLMTVVIGNLEMALAVLSGKSASNESLMDAMKAARRASELGAAMLTYLGQALVRRQPMDLSETCRNFLDDLQALMPPRVTLETDLGVKGLVVRADAGLLRQMLRSLVANAGEAVGGEGGTVFLDVRSASPADIAGSGYRPVEFQPEAEGYACLEVKDTGCGIAPGDYEKLFDPFYTTKFTGRGLGLSLVLGVVKAHDGCITMDSEPGRGSVFKVFLPLQTD